MTLVFDYGGVIVDLDPTRCIEAFQRLGLDIRPFLGTYRQGGVFSLLEEGRIDVPTFCRELRKLGIREEVTDEEIVKAWEDYTVGIPAERLALLEKIHANYRTAVLSNTNPIHWQQAEEKFFTSCGRRREDYFEQAFLSYRLQLQKPDPALYARVAEELGEKPEDILFFDDSLTNCEAAEQCGWKALLAPANSGWFKYFDAHGKLILP